MRKSIQFCLWRAPSGHLSSRNRCLCREALRYTGELRRAIDCFNGPIPHDSPQRYLRQDVGDAILSYLSRVPRGKSIKDLVHKLEEGRCIFGVIKSPNEIVTKVVKAYIQIGRPEWIFRKQTLAGLPQKKG